MVNFKGSISNLLAVYGCIFPKLFLSFMICFTRFLIWSWIEMLIIGFWGNLLDIPGGKLDSPNPGGAIIPGNPTGGAKLSPCDPGMLIPIGIAVIPWGIPWMGYELAGLLFYLLLASLCFLIFSSVSLAFLSACLIFLSVLVSTLISKVILAPSL